MSAQLLVDAFRPRSAESPWAGGLMAIVAHVLLVIALTMGVSWRIHQPEGGEAELWSAVPQAAAPAPVAAIEPPPPPPPPQPQAQPEPQPEPQPEAQIAIEKPKPQPKPVAHKKVEKKPEPPKPAKAATATKPVKTAKPAKAEPKTATLKSGRDDLLARMNRELGGDGTAQAGSGKQAVSSGPSANYKGRLIARIKPNIVFPGMINGNPEAVVTVVADASGRIVSQRLTQSSGVALWDAAVQRAIERTEVLPLDENGRMPSPLELRFKPRDF